MNLSKVDEQVSVSGQITPEDLEQLKSAGVEIVVCNRPDREETDQTDFRLIAEKADELGMQAQNISFTAGQMGPQHVEEFRQLLSTDKRIHAYCRTGSRSKTLWEAARGGSPASKDSQQTNGSAAIRHYEVVIVGAGSGGIAAAASLLKRRSHTRIALIDPADDHYYQPGWTMVGCGVFDVASTCRKMKDVIPKGVTWIQQAVTEFLPMENKVRLANGTEVHYQQLVVAAGLKLNWGAVEGLSETLGRNGVTSNYRYDLAPYTWQLVQELKGGKAVFTQPAMPIKCAGAPQKAMYLSCDHWLKQGRLKDMEVGFYNVGEVLFGVPDYVPALQSYVDKYGINLHFTHNLVKIDGEKKKAWFSRKTESGDEERIEADFDMIHVCPPQCAPDFIRSSSLADSNGWLDVDPDSLRHKFFENVWGLGDCTNTSNAKTMAAARKQAPVVAQNLCDVMQGKHAHAFYDGYGSCPLTVERGKIVLAEFLYGGKVAPTFPRWLNDGTKATRFAWELKVRVLPAIYWHAMLKGHEWFTKPAKEARLQHQSA